MRKLLRIEKIIKKLVNPGANRDQVSPAPKSNNIWGFFQKKSNFSLKFIIIQISDIAESQNWVLGRSGLLLYNEACVVASNHHVVLISWRTSDSARLTCLELPTKQTHKTSWITPLVIFAAEMGKKIRFVPALHLFQHLAAGIPAPLHRVPISVPPGQQHLPLHRHRGGWHLPGGVR